MITVTGAGGPFGRHAIEALLARGVDASRLVAVVRDPARAGDLAARGVSVRRGDYDQPETLGDALAGTERLLLVSGNAVGRRVPQHAAVVTAARAAGVRLLAYTSAPRASSTPMKLAAEHRATEVLIRESGLPFVFLRNNWYFENYTAQLDSILAHGALLGSAGEGRVAGAARADLAAGAAAVLAGDGHEGHTYELGGDQPFTLAELAAEVARQSGREVVYKDLPVAAYRAALEGAGVPAPMAEILADCDLAIRGGALFDDSGALRRLIGRPTTTLADAVAAGLRATAGAR